MRHDARRKIADEEATAERRYAAKMSRHEAYVVEHGNDGAARLTLLKWVIGGLLFAIVGFFVGDESLAEWFRTSVFLMVVCTGIGLYRARYFSRF
jgi:hypothetical protein